MGGGPGTIHLWPGDCGDCGEHSSRSKRFAAVQQALSWDLSQDSLGPNGDSENGRECFYMLPCE